MGFYLRLRLELLDEVVVIVAVTKEGGGFWKVLSCSEILLQRLRRVIHSLGCCMWRMK